MIFPEALQHFDEQIFFCINKKWSNHLFDMIMPPIRDKYFWIPLYFLTAVIIAWKFKTKGIYLILLLGLNFAISDQLSSAVIKPWVARDRPCNNPLIKNEVILRVDSCGVGKSFTSSHATNTFAFAMLLSLLFRKRSKRIAPLFFFWATLVSFAQIYVGVHYPLDILGGALLGILISVLIYYLSKKLLFNQIGWEY
jgi:undecaprenyl-diphosphatase